MQDTAQDALKFVLSRYGLSILDTPRSLATLLKQHAKTVPQEVQLLLAAANHGVVQIIRDDPRHDPKSLVRVLMMHGATNEARAEWAVSAWTAALAHVDRTETPEKVPPSNNVRIAYALAAGAATAIIAYLIWGR